MGLIADAGRRWEQAKKELDVAEAGDNKKARLMAEKKLQEAADAYHSAVRDQPMGIDDSEDATYRQAHATAGSGDAKDPLMIADAETEVAGSLKTESTSGTNKG